jgi:ribosomal protein S18 acetylase RimI-like enzyme
MFVAQERRLRSMSNTTLPLEYSHYREAAGVLARAFQDDPVVMAVLKGLTLEERIKMLMISFDLDLQTCGPKGCPLEVVKGDKIAGAAVIHRPGAYPLPASEQIGLLWKVFTKGLTTTWALSAYGRWLKWLIAIEKKHPREPHYYLEFIGIDTPFQGKSLGSQMMQSLVNRADEECRGCYLENGNPRNVPFYRRFGFQIMAEETVVGVPTWFMWRPPVRRPKMTVS